MEDEGNSKDSQPVPDTVTVKTPGATGPVFRATLKGVFSELWPVAAGAVFGVLIRFLFSDEPGGLMSAMAAPFIYFTPFAVGAVTVYAAERTERRSWVYYMGVGALANLFFIIGTMLILIEGLICAIVIAPLFVVIGALGGLVMGAVCRVTNWPKQTVSCVAVLPLLLAAVLPQGEEPVVIRTIERSVQVAASSEEVWQHLMNADHIQPTEVERGWLYRIGVPLPKSGLARELSDGTLVRDISMGKQIQFEQVADDWRPQQYVRWTYRFDENSFPPSSLDDHVKIGGHYFDLINTEYSIKESAPSRSTLRIKFQYRISTQFNWYADPIARLLVGNFEDVILDFYKSRAERQTSVVRGSQTERQYHCRANFEVIKRLNI